MRKADAVKILSFLLLTVDLVSSQSYYKAINWDKYGNGGYSDSSARADFGSVTGWRNERAMISSGTLRITLLKHALSGAGGIISNTKIPDGSAYEMDFDVKYHSQFDWSRGGKVGFGFGIGNGNTGCNVATDGNGGTLRLMWYHNPSNGRVYLQPYLYHKDMPGPCGENFGKSYPSSGKWDDNDVKYQWPIPDRNGKKQHNINNDVYLAQLDRLEAAIKAKRPRKKNHIVFHHDNARPHVEHRVIQSINDKGWELLEHSPYAPTEAPTDYHVNCSLKNWQTGKVYDGLDDLVADVKAWIASKDRHFFARGIDRLPSKWEAVIEVDGDYAPE
ncbi:unnamed protein product [Didymodactylos carnosus]|uniref:Uncharacterized protein n=1 Tax=Didymodactylos carnosus TaxID=1234261 RepID=A0A814NXU2_9BILA|nr:unnamed protein product [Didymodactylos carnosus]CAF3864622.1 unnamed protein product [Didymodactylos carnosus]